MLQNTSFPYSAVCFHELEQGNYLGLTSCSWVVRALVGQPRGPGSNPGGFVQSQLVQGENPYLAAAYIHDLVL